MKADNDNENTKPRIAAHGEWVGDEFYPDTPFHKLSKAAIEEKRKAQWRAMHKERARLAVRMKIGKDWDGKADNDNINWPLAKALLAEGNGDLLKYAMKYRQIYNTAKSEAVLGGTGVVMRDGFALDRHVHIRENGTIAYKHVRQRTAAEVDIPAKMYVPPFDDEVAEAQRNVVRIPKPWNGDKPVNDMLDAQALLSGLQFRLGAVCEPFEMACIDGATLAEVGAASGASSRDGKPAAGRAVCHLALITIRDTLGKVVRQDLAA